MQHKLHGVERNRDALSTQDLTEGLEVQSAGKDGASDSSPGEPAPHNSSISGNRKQVHYKSGHHPSRNESLQYETPEIWIGLHIGPTRI